MFATFTYLMCFVNLTHPNVIDLTDENNTNYVNLYRVDFISFFKSYQGLY